MQLEDQSFMAANSLFFDELCAFRESKKTQCVQTLAHTLYVHRENRQFTCIVTFRGCIESPAERRTSARYSRLKTCDCCRPILHLLISEL